MIRFTSFVSKVAAVSAIKKIPAPILTQLNSRMNMSTIEATTSSEMKKAISSNISDVLQNMVQTGVFQNNSSSDENSLITEETKDPLKVAIMYDLDAVDFTIKALSKSFPKKFQHRFAVKSCPLSFFLKKVINAGMGMECASLMEVKHALKLGCAPEKIVFDSPCKTDYDLAFALSAGVSINADSFAELEKILKILKRDFSDTPERIPIIGLRVNPLIGMGSNKYLSVSMSSSKFGIPLTEENRAKIIDLFKEHAFLKALHCHVGSQGCGLDMLAAGAETIQNLADDIDAAVGNSQVTTLNIGGGLPVNFSGDEVTPTYSDYASVLEEKVPSLYHGNRTILTEYGRSLCAKTSWTVSEVEYVKTSPEVRIGIIHAGSDLFLRTCYVPELFPHRLEVFTEDGKPSTAPIEPHNIAGPLCFGGDILGRKVDIPAVMPGDYIVVKDTGSNTISMFSRHCSRLAPAVYGYRRSGEEISLQLLKPQESPDDILKFWG